MVNEHSSKYTVLPLPEKNGRQKPLWIRINISLTFLDVFGSPGGSKFLTPIKDMNMEELNACLKSFYTSATKQDGSFYKKTSLKSIRAAIHRFLRSSPRSKQFPITSHAAFTETNKVLDAFPKDPRKSGKIAGLVQKKSRSSRFRSSSTAANPD